MDAAARDAALLPPDAPLSGVARLDVDRSDGTGAPPGHGTRPPAVGPDDTAATARGTLRRLVEASGGASLALAATSPRTGRPLH
jgi:hypothetical protein